MLTLPPSLALLITVQAMDKMEGEWQGVNLEIVGYRETGTYVLKGFDVIQQVHTYISSSQHPSSLLLTHPLLSPPSLSLSC